MQLHIITGIPSSKPLLPHWKEAYSVCPSPPLNGQNLPGRRNTDFLVYSHAQHFHTLLGGTIPRCLRNGAPHIAKAASKI